MLMNSVELGFLLSYTRKQSQELFGVAQQETI